MAAKYEARVAPWKRQEVRQLTKLIEDSPVVGIARIDKLPSRQFQEVRAAVREDAQIRVSKNSLILRALDDIDGSKDTLEDLEDHVEGQTALILSDSNPFKLFRTIENSKANAPAKPGDIAPKDIVVEKGDTPFPPGPIVGDLQKAGLPAKIEGGKVVIAKTTTVVEEGEEISGDLAGALTRLEINPMIVGLDVQAVWEDGTIFDRDALDIDPDAFVTDLVAAHGRAMALAVETSYPTTRTVPLLIAKAVRGARGLALDAGVPAPEIIEELVARGHAHAKALADLADVDISAPAPTEDASEAEDEAPETEDTEAEDADEAPETEDTEAEDADEADGDESEGTTEASDEDAGSEAADAEPEGEAEADEEEN